MRLRAATAKPRSAWCRMTTSTVSKNDLRAYTCHGVAQQSRMTTSAC